MRLVHGTAISLNLGRILSRFWLRLYREENGKHETSRINRRWVKHSEAMKPQMLTVVAWMPSGCSFLSFPNCKVETAVLATWNLTAKRQRMLQRIFYFLHGDHGVVLFNSCTYEYHSLQFQRLLSTSKSRTLKRCCRLFDKRMKEARVNFNRRLQENWMKNLSG